KMRRFIFAERNGIHIIDLQKTLRQLELAQKLVREVVLRGENVLFVCTKRQLAAIVRGEADRCGAMYVTERWLGGMLTNYGTVKKQVRKLKELEAGSEAGEFENYTKKEQLLMSRQRDKLSKYLEGIKQMNRLPGLLFIVDSKKERIAVTEANKLGIPIVAIADTNADPDLLTVPIAANDDAIRSVELLTQVIADTIAEARREAPARTEEDESESYVYSTDRGAEPAGDDDRRRGGGGGGGNKRRPRRRRANPGAIAAARRPQDGAPEGGEEAPEGEATE
nr:30S ribosomal protein S2 [Gemmatimonadaceae bacterium]